MFFTYSFLRRSLMFFGFAVVMLMSALTASAKIPDRKETLTQKELLSVAERWRLEQSQSAISLDDVENCRQAAENGDPAAQYRMGHLYHHGLRIRKDLEKAAFWYEKAAAAGVVQAEYELGFISAEREKSGWNSPVVSAHFRKAAEKGFPPGQFMLASCLEIGGDVATNLTESIKWYQAAASNNYAPAQFILGTLHENGEGLPRNPKEAIRLYRLAADQQFPIAQHALGVRYAIGEGVNQDFKEAAKFYRLAAEQGYVSSQFNLGYNYLNGKGVEQNKTEAMKWFRRAVEQGFAEAQYIYGLFRLCGDDGIEKDEKEAVTLLKKAVEKNNPGAQAVLGYAYIHGFGVEENAGLALDLIRKSAATGHFLGLRYLAGMNAEGTGIPEDRVEAYKWFTLAVQQGDEEARRLRDRLVKEMNGQQMLEGTARASAFIPSPSEEVNAPHMIHRRTPSSEATRLQAKIVNFGVFTPPTIQAVVPATNDPTGRHHSTKGNPSILTQTNQIHAKLGLLFGVTLEISGLDARQGAIVDVLTAWKHPVMTKPDGTKITGFNFISPKLVNADGRVLFWVGYCFENEYEMVSGDWRLEVSYEGKTLITQNFTVL